MAIGDQLTPGRPVEIEFAADLGLPSANQELMLIGHAASGASSGSVAAYTVAQINNVADPVAALEEAETKFGVGSELAKMVVAAVEAVQGGGTFPAIKCVPLLYTDTGFGPSDEALTAAGKKKAEYVASCYDGTDNTLRGKLKDLCLAMSGPQRVHNNQFGTIGVVANMDETDPSLLPAPDTQYLCAVTLRDTGDMGANPYSVAELAAACANFMASNGAPFNPQHGLTIPGVTAPADEKDWYTIGAGLESEVALTKGWSPLKVKPNGEVAVVRMRTTRITTNGTVVASSYYDVTDFNVLYFWRKTQYTRVSQPDLTNVKASTDKATLIKSEYIRLAMVFQEQGMFQNVEGLAKQFTVTRSLTDRHRFDAVTPVNVVPGLAVVATTIRATTEGDTITV